MSGGGNRAGGPGAATQPYPYMGGGGAMGGAMPLQGAQASSPYGSIQGSPMSQQNLPAAAPLGGGGMPGGMGGGGGFGGTQPAHGSPVFVPPQGSQSALAAMSSSPGALYGGMPPPPQGGQMISPQGSQYGAPPMQPPHPGLLQAGPMGQPGRFLQPPQQRIQPGFGRFGGRR